MAIKTQTISLVNATKYKPQALQAGIAESAFPALLEGGSVTDSAQALDIIAAQGMGGVHYPDRDLMDAAIAMMAALMQRHGVSNASPGEASRLAGIALMYATAIVEKARA